MAAEGALVAGMAALAGLAALRSALSRETDSHGSAGWAAPGRDLLFRSDRPLPPSSFALSRPGRRIVALPAVEAMRHGVILGATGTGKSRGFFLPNAARAVGESIVCSDPKSELWRYTSGLHAEAVRFAPAEPGASHCFNWVPLCRDARTAEIVARAVVESGQTGKTEQAWLDLEAAFLAALFAHASTLPEPTPLTAYRLFTRQPMEALMEQLAGSESPAAREQATILLATSERMRGSFVPVVAARLQFLRDPAVARFTSASHFAPDFAALRYRPIAVYWCVRETDMARLRPLTSLFFALLLDRVTEPACDEDPESLVPVTIMLDEVANIGTIPGLDVTSSVARGRGVSLWLGLQGLSQLEARYGRDNAKTILTNMGTKVALSGLDVDTAEWVSRSLGEVTEETRRASWHRPFLSVVPSNTGVSEGAHARRLLTPDEVRRVGQDQSIVIVGNRRPMLLDKGFYDTPPVTAAAPSLGRAQGAELPELPLPARRALPPPFPTDLD